jgi:hypothetical protein
MTNKTFPFILLVVLLAVLQSTQAELTFVPGHYYTSNYFSNTITQYNSAGDVVGSLTLPSSYGREVRGLTFGRDNLLYATVVTDSGFSVLALNSAGVIQQAYEGDVYVAGNLSFGKITIDGQYLYVAGQDQLTRFLLGNPSSGTPIYTNNQVFDVDPLPNGNLLVASAYEIQEITNTGAVVRTIRLIGNGGYFTDIRGIEYNPVTHDLFVTELGHTGFFFQIMRLEAISGLLLDSTTFTYADDLFLTASGQLLVGSSTENPAFYDQDLNFHGMLHGEPQMFVTQFVPEPSSVALSLSGALLLAIARRYRSNRLCSTRAPKSAPRTH